MGLKKYQLILFWKVTWVRNKTPEFWNRVKYVPQITDSAEVLTYTKIQHLETTSIYRAAATGVRCNRRRWRPCRSWSGRCCRPNVRPDTSGHTSLWHYWWNELQSCFWRHRQGSANSRDWRPRRPGGTRLWPFWHSVQGPQPKQGPGSLGITSSDWSTVVQASYARGDPQTWADAHRPLCAHRGPDNWGRELKKFHLPWHSHRRRTTAN